MASQKTVLLLVVLVSAALAARQASNLKNGKGQGKQKQNQRVGGWTSADQNDETVQQLAQFAAGQICSIFVVDAVQKAETQVVAGMNYRMDILVSKAWKCKVHVFEQSWTNTTRLTSFACKSVP
ncbi:uncharacterized protein LOC127869307 [Dreissena polymorpha]|uniref:Cystatin domain-containing protein n=1 Tax=Dreissena polymorpha TaxID=45954 RepID=A0A9D4RNA9_DREPO|nr:uncharacterized protein LOC127869307 [Dreissena polymorpha]XP_052267721.1 uncharacterized protein LOC127869307 [Dreissena polymorpha]KAH3874769.1 hypothetical protein DPMN_038022 [Dreissena polymorpha]